MCAVPDIDVLEYVWILSNRGDTRIGEGELGETAVGLAWSWVDLNFSCFALLDNDVDVNRRVAMLILAKEEAVRTKVNDIAATIDNRLLERPGYAITLNNTITETEVACRAVATSSIDVEEVAALVSADYWID